MILLWGLMEDTPMQMVYQELRNAGADIFYLDHRDIFRCEIETTCLNGTAAQTVLHTPSGAVNMRNIRVAYCRPYNYRDYTEVRGKDVHDPLVMQAAGFEAHLASWLDASEAFVVNKTGPMATNNSKPLQLSLIKRAGFNIPETFITNDAGQARAFIDAQGDVIFKSVSGQRSIVEQVSEAHAGLMEDVKWCPTLFQQCLPGSNYRVHVVKDELYTVRIESDRLDYRYGNTRLIVEELPGVIAQKCLKINAMLGLHFSGIDLMRTPDDEWYCFEVNPSPAYSYFQLNCGLPIAAALARLLAEEDAKM